MHQCIQFILFWNDTTCFRQSFRPSPGVQDCTYSNKHMSDRYCCLLAVRSLELYIQQQAFAKQILLSACCQQFKTVHTATDICQTHTAVCLLASRQQYLFGCCMYSLELSMMHRRSSETCRISFQNKIIDTLVHLIDFTVEIKILSCDRCSVY
jgi:hypothetical protein